MNLLSKTTFNLMTATACTLGLASFSLSSYAIDAYDATYSADIQSSVSFSGTLNRKLSKGENGQWLLKDDISSLLASINESSVLNITDNKVQPIKYHYLRKVFGKKKKRDVDFDWSQKQATNRDKKTISLVANSQDRLSYQLQLQLDLQAGKRGTLSYPVVKGSSIETMTFVESGTETVKTPLGNLKSLKFKLDRGSNAKRETFIWFAIDRNFVISKLKQTESDGKSYAITLDKLS